MLSARAPVSMPEMHPQAAFPVHFSILPFSNPFVCLQTPLTAVKQSIDANQDRSTLNSFIKLDMKSMLSSGTRPSIRESFLGTGPNCVQTKRPASN
jgi:hypothetical protein